MTSPQEGLNLQGGLRLVKTHMMFVAIASSKIYD
jgi:hypothetical protein